MIRRYRKSVLIRYMLTYVGIAIAACLVLGTILFTTSVAHLESSAEKAAQEQMEVMSADFIRQMNAMNDMAVIIKTTLYYQPSYIGRNAYYQTDLLGRFSRFYGYSPLIDEYYLYYPQEDIVFSSMAEYSFHVFSEYYLCNAGREDLRAAIAQADVFLTIQARPDDVFRVFPIRFHGLSGDSTAYLLIAMNRNDVVKRYAELFNIRSGMQIRYNGELLFGEKNVSADSFVSAEYLNGTITFSSSRGISGESVFITGFRKVMIAVILAIAAAFAAIAAALAYGSYRPIQRLARKLNGQSAGGENEMKTIERVLEDIKSESSGSMNRLTESLEKIARLNACLKQHILLLILDGEYDLRLKSRMADAGMNFNRSVFCALHVTCEGKPDGDVLCRQIDAVSDESVTLYSAQLSGVRGWAAVVCADCADDIMTLFEVLPEILCEKGFQVSVRMGKPCDRPELIAQSFVQAESGWDGGKSSDRFAAPQWYDMLEVQLLKESLRDALEESALMYLNSILDDLKAHCASKLIMRYLFVDLTYQIISTGQQFNCLFIDQEVQLAVVSTDIEAFRTALSRLIRGICAQIPRSASKMPEAVHNVIEYIEMHAKEYDVCLDSVAGACGISTKQVNRLVKNAVGMTFKEYITHIRMQQAMLMLRAGVSSTETAGRIGYSDISYFTKLFRTYTGYTPGRYRVQCEAAGAEDANDKETADKEQETESLFLSRGKAEKT